MPVYPTHPIFQSCDLKIDMGPSTPYNMDGSREYTYKYQVVVRKPVDEITACSAPCIPLPFSLHDRDYAALCTNISGDLQDKEDWGIWIVTVRFSTRIREGGPPGSPGAAGGSPYQSPENSGGGQNNPEFEPPDIEWDHEVINKAPPKDLDKKAFLNAAGQPFTPAPTFEYAYSVLSISRNELDYNNKTAAKYSFAVNKDAFLGYPPKTVQCMPPKAKLTYRGNIRYWRVSYRLRFGIMGDDGKPIPWDPIEVLNQGLMELKKLPGKPDPVLVPIRRNGVVVSQPVLLDRNGGQLFANFNVFAGPPQLDPVYLKFRLRPALSFADLIRNGLGGAL